MNKKAEEQQRGKIKNGVVVTKQVDFKVMGENKVLQEKSRKRLPMEKTLRSPKKQIADIEHAMNFNRYLHETKIQGDQGTDSHVTSLRQPFDQSQFQNIENTVPSDKNTKDGGANEGVTKNVLINSSEA